MARHGKAIEPEAGAGRVGQLAHCPAGGRVWWISARFLTPGDLANEVARGWPVGQVDVAGSLLALADIAAPARRLLHQYWAPVSGRGRELGACGRQKISTADVDERPAAGFNGWKVWAVRQSFSPSNV